MNFDEVRAGEGPDGRRQRLLQPYLAILPTLSNEQQTHILTILDAASAELRAATADTTLSPERQTAATRYVRADLSNRIAFALTTEQLPAFNAQLIRQNPPGQNGGGGFGGPGGGFQGGGPGEGGFGGPGEGGPGGGAQEDFAQTRARLLAGYEDVMDELSVKQKTDILAILKTADAEATNVRADTKLSVVQKTQSLQKIHDDVNTKVLPLLEADQVADWKKAHAAKRLELAKLAATPLPAPEPQAPLQPQPQPQDAF